MIDINELRRKLGSDDIVDHIDIHANVKPIITELIDRLEAAEKDIALKERVIDSLGLALNAAAHERDNLRAEVESWKGLAQQFGNELDTVRAKIAEMEKQEPVAFALYSGWARKAVYLSEIEACEQRDRRQLTADLGGSLEAYRVVPLYPAPGAKGE
jgi:chromosome segregation ATPase